MPRPDLLHRLQEGRRKRCTLILGPAGSGKTTVLLNWRKALLGLDFDVAWLTLSPVDNHPARFFSCLVASLAAVDAQAVREAAILSTYDDVSSAEHWALALVQGLAARQRQLVLMLDDVHCIDDPRIAAALQWVLDYAPPTLHLVLSSRSMPSLELSRLRAHGDLAEFDFRDLRFSPEESAHFLSAHVTHISAEDCHKLHQLTDGWAAGLQLFALDLRTRKSSDFAPVQLSNPHMFAHYFEHEVLDQLAPDALDLLMRLSICNRFCASLASSLIGQPRGIARMMHRLDQLDRDNLFLSTVQSSDHETWYRLHPLLREVLQERLKTQLPDALAALHAVAWRWFAERLHADEAIRHAVCAGHASDAAAMLIAMSNEMMVRGEFARIAILLRHIPPEEMRKHFKLGVLKSYVQLNSHGLPHAVARTQALLAEQTPRTPEESWQLTALHATLQAYQDDPIRASELEPALLAIPAEADDFVLATRRNVLAWLYIQRCEYARVRELFADGGCSSTSQRSDLVGQCLLGLSHMLAGQVVLAERIFRDVLATADAHGSKLAGPGFMAAGFLSEILFEINKMDEIFHILKNRIQVLDRGVTPDSVLRVLLNLAIAHRLAGRRLDGWEWLERLEDYARRQKLNRLLAFALNFRVNWHLLDKQELQAMEAMNELQTLCPQQSLTHASPEITLLQHTSRSRILLSQGLPEMALAELEAALRLCKSSGRMRSVPHLQLQTAVVLRQLGRTEAAWTHALKALQLGQQQSMVSSLLHAAPEAYTLLTELSQQRSDLLDPIQSFYLQRLLAAGARHAGEDDLLHAPSCPDKAITDILSTRELEVIHLLNQAMPNKKIARVLGISPETVKWHLKKIYIKLDVSGRDAAVARLRDLTLANSAH